MHTKRYAVIALLVLAIMTAPLLADTFNTTELASEATKIKDFIFGWGSKIAAIFGAAIGVMQSLFTGSIRPILFFGGLALGIGFLPKFIEMVFSTPLPTGAG